MGKRERRTVPAADLEPAAGAFAGALVRKHVALSGYCQGPLDTSLFWPHTSLLVSLCK